MQGRAAVMDPKYKASFRMNSLFVSENVRQAVNEGRADYVPIFLSEIPILFKRKILPIDVALMQVSPPDKHGYCSLGVSVDIASAALKNAKHVIAQVNPRMPRTMGDGIIHQDELDVMVSMEQELPEIGGSGALDEIATRIGNFCAELVDDGATLQTGIGAIPDAVLKSLTNHKELGVHTEMFSDGIIPLIEKGVITNHIRKSTGTKL
jgi:acyl-CoA hydrolase